MSPPTFTETDRYPRALAAAQLDHAAFCHAYNTHQAIEPHMLDVLTDLDALLRTEPGRIPPAQLACALDRAACRLHRAAQTARREP